MTTEEAHEQMREYVRLFEKFWKEGTSSSAERAKAVRQRLNEHWGAQYDTLPCYIVCYDAVHAAE